ncbi:Transcriptional regulator containing an amidase domain and an AraC-type DNA-binding HTH domain [Paraburkholderia piptadeniae]|uniref:Transcriptional regulator containing an amidase domain and an AraC-type DNA-binding HTH domain n=2 Tax=Paraburkholderia piptadeniae TaxID=1701573 RepID=A0A1N7RYH2_9BURK|nr:Transcriptional regulator containing an amidase domain and an AraC-type DNA-binding HTH domain [Paraburkholderia piptadeniae]
MHIGILVLPGHRASDIVAAMDTLSLLDGGSVSGEPYRFQLIGLDVRSVAGKSGLALMADSTVATAAPDFDTLLISGSGESVRSRTHPALVEWIAAAGRNARRIGAVGEAVSLLASAGLLDGCTVALHPAALRRFSRRWPAVIARSDQSVIRDGKVLTAFGPESSVELALELVRDDFGPFVASQLAQRLDNCCRTATRQTAHPCLRMGTRACIRDLQHYILTHLSADLCVSRLAARAGMSERHFARVFVRETGTTPLEFVRVQRVTRAMQLLAQPTHSIARVARLCGFSGTHALRRNVAAVLGTMPLEH